MSGQNLSWRNIIIRQFAKGYQALLFESIDELFLKFLFLSSLGQNTFADQRLSSSVAHGLSRFE